MEKSQPSHIAKFLSYLGVLAGIFILAKLFSSIPMVIAYFVIAIAICYLINPFVDKLETWRVPRSLSIALIFCAFAAVVVVGLMVLIPRIKDEVQALVNQFPRYSATIMDLWDRFMERYGWIQQEKAFQHVIEKITQQVQKYGLGMVSRALGGVFSLMSILPGLVVIPVLVYYFLKDDHIMKKSFLAALPAPWRPDAQQLMDSTNKAIGGFIQGQLKLCLAMGILTWAAMAFIAHLPYALIMGVIAGVTEFIPYLGPILAAILPLGVAAFEGLDKVVIVLVLAFVIQLIEGNILAPRIMSSDVGMHPVVIIFVLMAGGQVGGVMGMIVALPSAVLIKVLFDHFYMEKFVKKHEPVTAAGPAADAVEPPAQDDAADKDAEPAQD